jgi:hypothetical protein
MNTNKTKANSDRRKGWNSLNALGESLYYSLRLHVVNIDIAISYDDLVLSESPRMAKYLGRQRKPPSQPWRTFLANHVEQMASIDFFTVPTATFRVLFREKNGHERGL